MRIYLAWPDEKASIGNVTVWLPKRASTYIRRSQEDIKILRRVEAVLQKNGIELIHNGWTGIKNQRTGYVRRKGNNAAHHGSNS